MAALAPGVSDIAVYDLTTVRRPTVGQVVPVDAPRTDTVQVHRLEMPEVDLDRLWQTDVPPPAQRSANHLGVEEGLLGVLAVVLQEPVELVVGGKNHSHSSVVSVGQQGLGGQLH